MAGGSGQPNCQQHPKLPLCHLPVPLHWHWHLHQDSVLPLLPLLLSRKVCDRWGTVLYYAILLECVELGSLSLFINFLLFICVSEVCWARKLFFVTVYFWQVYEAGKPFCVTVIFEVRCHRWMYDLVSGLWHWVNLFSLVIFFAVYLGPTMHFLHLRWCAQIQIKGCMYLYKNAWFLPQSSMYLNITVWCTVYQNICHIQ